MTYNPKNNYPQLVEKQSFLLHFYSQSGYRASMYKLAVHLLCT